MYLLELEMVVNGLRIWTLKKNLKERRFVPKMKNMKKIWRKKILQIVI